MTLNSLKLKHRSGSLTWTHGFTERALPVCSPLPAGSAVVGIYEGHLTCESLCQHGEGSGLVPLQNTRMRSHDQQPVASTSAAVAVLTLLPTPAHTFYTTFQFHMCFYLRSLPVQCSSPAAEGVWPRSTGTSGYSPG